MPIHDYKCPMCHRRREVFLKIVDMSSTVYCNCGQPMNKMPSAPYIQADYAPYESPVEPGRIIHGKRQHEEHLKETGCRILEPGESDAYRRRLQHDNDELDRKIGDTTDALIANMPTDKRDKLAAEMEGGLDARIERSTPKFNNV